MMMTPAIYLLWAFVGTSGARAPLDRGGGELSCPFGVFAAAPEDPGLPGRLSDPEEGENPPGGDAPAGFVGGDLDEADPRPRPEDFAGALREPGERDSARPGEADSAHGSFSGFFETHFSGRAWRDNVWRDYLTEPPVLFPLALGASAAAVSHWDRRLENRAQGVFGDRKPIANASAGVILLGSIGVGALFPGPGRNGWDELWNEGEAYAVATGVTSGLKIAVGRHRPGGSGRNRSFPSDHATIAFTGATLIELNSGPELGIPALLLAGVCAVSRLDTGDHFPSDVLAGASIGAMVAGMFDALHWGTGREGRGICAPPLDVRMAWDRGPSVTIGAERAF